MLKKHKGAGTALVTPIHEDGSISYPVFRELLHIQVENDADAVVVAGTTGEGSTLTDEEHLELVRVAVKEIKGRIPVIAAAIFCSLHRKLFTAIRFL